MIYMFANGRLDLGLRECTLDGQLVDLQPLVFDLLAYFLAHPGRAISKDELLDKVWGNDTGSDAVVARAVMKIRRAIGDDGQEPKILKTVHRIGYRLDLAVQRQGEPEVPPQARVREASLTALARGLVLLPCRNETGDAAFDWVAQGVPSLLQQFVDEQLPVALAPVDWSAPGVCAAGAGALTPACETFGASEALALTLQGREGALRLRCIRGRDEAGAQHQQWLGRSVIELVRNLSESLLPQSTRPSTEGDLSFWEEQLARALDLDRRGFVDRALALMDECVERLPPSPQLLLSHATMLRRMGRRDDAKRQGEAALALAEGTPNPALKAQALFEMANQAWHGVEPEQAARLCEAALAAAQEDPAAAAAVPDILSFYASIARERGDALVSIDLAERAIAASAALGHRAKETHARVVLGSNLMYAGQTDRAAGVLRRSVELAHREGLVLKEAFALRVLTQLDEQAGRYTLALDEARRSAALAASCGNVHLRDSARVEEVVTLVLLGRLDEAQALANRLQASVACTWENSYSLRYACALLAWCRGQGRVATEQMKDVADEGRRAGLRFASVARLEQCLQSVHLQDLPAAEAGLGDLRAAGADVAALQLEAALSLARGDRAGCIDQLRRAARVVMSDSVCRVLVDINLAWLLMEDGEIQEASSLIGQITEFQTEQPPARVLTAAYLSWQNPQALAQGEWEALLAASPRLVGRYPWMQEAAYIENLRAQRSPRLPELLSRACW